MRPDHTRTKGTAYETLDSFASAVGKTWTPPVELKRRAAHSCCLEASTSGLPGHDQESGADVFRA
jgi:hypothetical protein